MFKMATEARNDNHVGHFFMNQMNMKEEQEEICQIDAATGLQETKGSVLSRSIRLAQSFRRYGLEPGDVLALGGMNHLDVHIPFYAALMTGLPVAGVNPLFKYSEIKQQFKIVEPRIAFCQHEMYEDYQRAVQELGLETKIVTFDEGECTMTIFMDFYQDPEPEDQFKVVSFDVSKIPCWLVSTSGSTGFPKVSALSHSLVLRNVPFFVHNADQKTGSRRCALNLSSTQWVSACYNVLAMPINQVKLQTSAPPTTEHFIDIINQYKPVSTFSTPELLLYILQNETPCDLTCFDVIKLGGAKSPVSFLNALRARVRKDTKIINGYGLTETGLVLEAMPEGPLGNIGVTIQGIEAKLIDPNTGRTISEPNITGELLVRGSRLECYYNDPKATAEAFTNDGFFKTGDLMYRDEEGYYFFVDRLKMLIKYRNYQIVPNELEEVVLTHPAVAAVCVVGVPHPVDEERAAASVMVRAGADVTAEEVEAHVASQLSVNKHLHGGVVFLHEMPLTANGKIDRNKVKDIVLNILGEYEY